MFFFVAAEFAAIQPVSSIPAEIPSFQQGIEPFIAPFFPNKKRGANAPLYSNSGQVLFLT
jgi:hypothetical protein